MGSTEHPRFDSFVVSYCFLAVRVAIPLQPGPDIPPSKPVRPQRKKFIAGARIIGRAFAFSKPIFRQRGKLGPRTRKP